MPVKSRLSLAVAAALLLLAAAPAKAERGNAALSTKKYQRPATAGQRHNLRHIGITAAPIE